MSGAPSRKNPLMGERSRFGRTVANKKKIKKNKSAVILLTITKANKGQLEFKSQFRPALRVGQINPKSPSHGGGGRGERFTLWKPFFFSFFLSWFFCSKIFDFFIS